METGVTSYSFVTAVSSLQLNSYVPLCVVQSIVSVATFPALRKDLESLVHRRQWRLHLRLMATWTSGTASTLSILTSNHADYNHPNHNLPFFGSAQDVAASKAVHHGKLSVPLDDPWQQANSDRRCRS